MDPIKAAIKQAYKVRRIAQKYVYNGTAMQAVTNYNFWIIPLQNEELIKSSDPKETLKQLDLLIESLKLIGITRYCMDNIEIFAMIINSTWWWNRDVMNEVEQLERLLCKVPLCDCHLYCPTHAKEFGKLV